ncbi:uncharacterized protein LOC110703860 [Chenopodium quinoa]|uniref:uncharacterized protein LOC110703860 n=1 Tax=Chenopodium quinoa TaxID=63459 RepID=UPI000B7761D4|nr:uncharacterized protein LOC110703860 [Chenopodium quinoa]
MSFMLENFENYWAEIWKLKVTPKVRHFIWKCCFNSLPTRGVLEHRHLLEDPSCPWCGFEKESIIHATISCPSATVLWHQSGCSEALEHMSSAGNFGDLVLERHSRLVVDFSNYTEKIYGKRVHSHAHIRVVWSPPPPDVIKINVDASTKDEGWVRLGAVARDHSSRVLFAGVRRVQARWDPLVAEGKAALFGLKKAKEYGYKDIIIESDSEILITKLKKNSCTLSTIDSIVEDIVFCSSNFSSMFWSHVKRDENFVAHHLARLVPFGCEQCWENHAPSEVSSYVFADLLTMI